MATPFFLLHLTVCGALGLLVGAAVGIETGAPVSVLGRVFAAGAVAGLVAATTGLIVVAVVDRRPR